MRERSTSFFAVTVLLVGCLTVGCAMGPPSYETATSAEPKENNSFEVSAHGNSETPRRKLEAFALLRAADETLKSGATKFRLVSDKESQTHGAYGGLIARTVILVIRTNKGDLAQADQGWIDAQKIVDAFGPRLKSTK